MNGRNARKIPVRRKKSPRERNFAFWVILVIISIYFFRLFSASSQGEVKTLSYGDFYGMLSAKPSLVASAVLTEDVITGKLTNGAQYSVTIPTQDEELITLLKENVGKDFKVEPPKTFWANVFFNLLGPILLLGVFWFLLSRSAANQGGSRLLQIGKSRARLANEGRQKITFNDVAGVDEAKEELKEIIEFLKDPKRFTKLGGKIPKGVLLIGPPGTGKTLLAKAVAGEAEVPFLSISGSDFVELFVGVGASRVRDLFEQAKRSSQSSGRGCIIFIDEIDAVGRQRFAGIGGGHDEREQTLNALLVEMDGFDTQEGVILLAATNRPDVLDPALLRPGRFDRVVVVDKPDLKGRTEILKVHMRNLKVSREVDLNSIGRQTPGFSGADIANLANEAALLAARKNKESIEQKDLEDAIERVMAGPERKSKVISKNERSVIACHESGHTLLSLLVPGYEMLHKVTIIPRGHAALGYTLKKPLEDRYIITKEELLAEITGLLGGRAAEEIMFSQITTGAQHDLHVATELARSMVCEYGMSEALGHLTFGKRERQVFLGRDLFEERNYSEEVARKIDAEITRIVDSCFDEAKKLLLENKEKLKKLSDALLEREVLTEQQVREIVGIPQEPPAAQEKEKTAS
jgi:cell division protease FtsH